jgi:diguanylate cyclase (GGDEF)-like protein/PAS domain S-box-containing protein
MPNTDPQLLAEALRNCEREPIHLIGSIQPTGVLIAIDVASLRIERVSANAGRIFQQAAGNLLGQALPDILGQAAIDSLLQPLGLADWRHAAVVSLSVPHHGILDALVFRSGSQLVIEFELEPYDTSDLFHRLFIPIRDALWRMDAESDFVKYTTTVVDQVRLLTGYDRVMMYRFDGNWDGEVIAESATPGCTSYLGNRFPASDIPAQARELFTRNLVRVITDVNAPPVALLAMPGSGQELDLTYSGLRSSSPIHLEYLGNMGVAASMTISLLQNGRLWGLIACHHFTAKHVPLRLRELEEFVGKTVSLKLSNLESSERNHLNARLRDLLNDLTWQIRNSPNIEHHVRESAVELLDVVRAQGAVVSLRGHHYAIGQTPTECQVDGLLAWLRTLPVAPVFSVDSLVEAYPAATDFADVASGMMIAPLDHELQSFILWFRAGISRTVTWAGQPNKSVIREKDSVRLSPRRSFATWVEIYRDKSLPWSKLEQDAATALSMAAIEVLSQRALRLSEENYRLLAEHSTDMIARLDAAGFFRYVSPACQSMLGISAEDMHGNSLADLILAEDRIVLANAIDLALGKATPNVAMLRFPHPDGQTIWIEATMKAMPDDGSGPQVVVNARDVTQRYSYQLAIEDLHRRNTMILEAAGEGVISLDCEGRIVYANDRAARLLKREPDQMLGQHCGSLLRMVERRGEAETEQDCLFLESVVARRQIQGNSSSLTTADGKRLSVDYVATPLIDDGEVSGCVVVFNESMERHRIAEQLNTSDVALNQALEAVMVTDANGIIVSVNRAFSDITGYSEEEALGQRPRLLKSGIHTHNFYQTMWEKISLDGRWAGEIWNRRKNGEIYPQWGTISAILDANGTVRNYVAVFSDISKAKQAEEKLFYLANHDPLTGLPNRMRYSDQLSRSIERAKRQKSRLAVAFIDLDRFKIVNDTLGHTAGDSFLQIVAERLSGILRRGDFLARWGGDEFVVTFEDIRDRGGLSEFIHRVVTGIAEPITIRGHELDPTISVGLAVYPDDALVATDLIKCADTAMYHAKEAGRNGFHFYAERYSDEVSLRFNLGSELRKAIKLDAFQLYFQPQVDSRSGRPVGIEALIRWQHPVRGLLAPGQFVSVAEELGLIDEIGHWVIEQACRQYRAWLDAGHQPPKLAVNIAPAQLRHELVDAVAALLSDYRIPEGALELEITEGALERADAVTEVMHGLCNLGLSLAVDDFGTGYSSLSHLKNYPVSCLKIDKSFVDGLPGSRQDMAIVRAIIALGSTLGMRVIAEGVELAEQHAVLRDAGVDTIQGYLFSRPLPADEIMAWIEKVGRKG